MKRLRCAIYTRKSSEEGLDQAFNSLHAQREACEAYVLSQAGEGWAASPALYDDGGFSGGDMNRPGLARLLAEIDAGQIDVVVVYKVDRLTRALGDFARIVERFDKAGVSFVSVTQAFNTTSSMGRLTLNVLLSFAQFEREVTGERIRDKLAASKSKGMWMGGVAPLGYDRPTDLTTRALVVNEVEAETVRRIFCRYLELGSVHRLVSWVREQGIRSKAYTTLKGQDRGGAAFSRGALFYLLRNPIYRGEIVHKDRRHAGAHPAIVDADLFAQVQASLASHIGERRVRVVKSGASPLSGRLFDACGVAMSPTFSQGRTGRRYRYYVSSTLQQGGSAPQDGVTRRITSAALEALLSERLQALLGEGLDRSVASGALVRVDALPDSLALTFKASLLPHGKVDPQAAFAATEKRLRADERLWCDPGQPEHVRLSIGVSPRLAGGRTRYLGVRGHRATASVRRDPVLIRALRTAHVRTADLLDPATAIAPVTSQYERNLLRLTCLAPDIQRAILEGRQPEALTLQQLILGDLPTDWASQRRALGF